MVWFVGLRFMGIYGATPDIMIATAFGALGPVALVVALYATLSQSQRTFVVPLKILAGAFALLLVLQLIDAGAKDRLDLEWFKFEWANVVMFAILPLAGVVHLWSMSRATR
jgi:hypothetical protein